MYGKGGQGRGREGRNTVFENEGNLTTGGESERRNTIMRKRKDSKNQKKRER